MGLIPIHAVVDEVTKEILVIKDTKKQCQKYKETTAVICNDKNIVVKNLYERDGRYYSFFGTEYFK